MENTNQFSPKGIARVIFTEEPAPALSKQLILEEGDNEIIFEILLNIFLEGLVIKKCINKLNSNKYRLAITEDMFVKFKQYFRSLGFDIRYNIKEFNEYISLTDEEYKNSYCRIYISDVMDDFCFTFGINLNFYRQTISFNDKNNLNKFIATFEDNDTLYCIHFSFYNGDEN